MRRQPVVDPPVDPSFRILIVCENASARFGGEAVIPLHYFRLLRNRGFAVWLVAHARTRPELADLFPGERRIRYVEERPLHRWLWRISKWLPSQLAYLTTGFVSRLAVQITQRRLVRDLIAAEGIDIVHQPTPVSPREPSFICDVGAPVVVGPMNGGMGYPPAFQPHRHGVEKALLALARSQAALLNRLFPGKRKASLLLVANERTRAVLPAGVCDQVSVLCENGVELDLWTTGPQSLQPEEDAVTFAFVGRLVALKSVDLLIEAFAVACRSTLTPMRLLIIGEGRERARLQRQAAAAFPPGPGQPATGQVRFTGWLSQTHCARELARVHGLVMPSVHDCGGAVILEAMSMGKPVIATAWGGALDYLDGACGILVAPSDRPSLVAGLAQAMVQLAASPLQRAAMGRAARRKVERDYDWEVKVEQVLALYRQVLQTAPRLSLA